MGKGGIAVAALCGVLLVSCGGDDEPATVNADDGEAVAEALAALAAAQDVAGAAVQARTIAAALGDEPELALIPAVDSKTVVQTLTEAEELTGRVDQCLAQELLAAKEALAADSGGGPSVENVSDAAPRSPTLTEAARSLKQAGYRVRGHESDNSGLPGKAPNAAFEVTGKDAGSNAFPTTVYEYETPEQAAFAYSGLLEQDAAFEEPLPSAVSGGLVYLGDGSEALAGIACEA